MKMKTSKTLLIGLAAIGFLLSCSNANRNEKSMATDYENNLDVKEISAVEEYSANVVTEETEDYNGANSKDDISGMATDGALELQKPIQPIKIIKNAQSRFLVEDVDSISEIMIDLAKKNGGYVSNMSYNQDPYEKENHLTVMVPSDSFEHFITNASKLALFIDYNNITSQDVTEEFVDLTNRIKVKEEVKKRYEEILRTKTKTVHDVLETERQIQLIQEEIESAKGRLNYINTKSAMSTIEMSLYEKVSHQEHPEVYARSFGNKSKNAFSTGWDMVKNLILGLIYIWPIILILGITFFLIRRSYRKKKKTA